MAAKDPDFLCCQVGSDGRIACDVHQASLLRFRDAETMTWRGSIALPVYWALLFSPQDFTATGATVDWAAGLANLERRRESCRAKSSPLLYRGFPRFLEWVRVAGGGQVDLDVSGLDAWRRGPLLAAVKQLMAFFDNAGTEPGPLPPRQDAPVLWRKRNGTTRLEAALPDLAWPDEVPLFAVRSDELADVTVGRPPFRKGPWPERRFAENELAPLDPKLRTAIQERAGLVREALKLCLNEIPETQIGNLEGIERMRTHYRSVRSEFQRKARHLAASSKTFSEAYDVFDDTELWRAMLAASEAWSPRMEASLARQESEVRTAMSLLGAPAAHAREIDFDRFPSGDDPL